MRTSRKPPFTAVLPVALALGLGGCEATESPAVVAGIADVPPALDIRPAADAPPATCWTRTTLAAPDPATAAVVEDGVGGAQLIAMARLCFRAGDS
ncbi:hypothetical protein [uncultured Phenylobacterium sp.]|uniref:hypothetical protein n=1 Tax=uncultured Phenylobacterium sp. TaxID=349273 RepID=UPI0025E78285|nr:hypothetical protein [uncultured Phenylobacterium sp.]